MDNHPLNHTGTWELLPWLVNGSIRDENRRRVEEHLRDCADCRDEHAFQQRLHAGMRDEPCDDRAARRALDLLLARIDEEPDAGDRMPARATRGGWLQRILIAALVVQTSAVVAVAMLWFAAGASIRGLPGEASYRTFSHADTAPATATIRLVPAPDLGVGALQQLLADSGLRIIGSSSDGTILALAPLAEPRADAGEPVPGSSLTALTIAHLRAQPGVLLAEPIVAPEDAP